MNLLWTIQLRLSVAEHLPLLGGFIGVLVCAGPSSNTGELNLAVTGLTPSQRVLLVVDAHRAAFKE